MKTIHIFAILLLSYTGFSQTTDSNENSIVESLGVPATAEHIYSAEQSQSAISQLKAHLSDNLVYPETMLDYAVEGTVEVEVKLLANGKIEDITISKSLNKEFDEAVLEAMHSIKKVKVKDKKYYGRKTLRLPVYFSMSN